MNNLADRLRGIVKPARVLLEPGGHARPDVVVPAAPETAGGQRDGLLSEPSGPVTRDLGLSRALDGAWCRDESGAQCYVVERRLEADSRHGRVRVGSMAETLQRAEREAPLLANGAPARLPFVFFDLETTGLSGGAGTYAFLVGCGWFDANGAFVTRQYVMTRPADERPMLRSVAAQLDTAGALVSFNGRSFDAPLLETRFLYHRLSWSAGRLPHVDVLHPARRFWRSDSADGGGASCSLGVLERTLLGTIRTDDIPGFEAPARYFRFIRTGDARLLSGVLEHNRLDLLSLAGLTARLLQLVNEGPDAAEGAREAVALGRVFERAGLPARAVESYARALTFPASRLVGPGALGSQGVVTTRIEAIRALAHLARRARRHAEAETWWHQLLELPDCPPAIVREAAEALAIHHEHRTRNFDLAREFAVRTVEPNARATRGRDVAHRLARIDRKRAAAERVCERPSLLDQLTPA